MTDLDALEAAHAKATVELTSDRGWVPGTRVPEPDERILVLVHQPGVASVSVFSSRADAGPWVISAAQGVRDSLARTLMLRDATPRKATP
jgi:hypothetical protein